MYIYTQQCRNSTYMKCSLQATLKWAAQRMHSKVIRLVMHNANTPPTDISQLHSFLGCCNFYECFVKHYSELAAPLIDLLGSKVLWVWSAAEQAAFDTLKQALCTEPVLLMPYLRGDFVVGTDASQQSIGGVI